MSTLPGAVGDCERFVDGLLDQPVNTLTSLAFVLAGMVVFMRLWRRRDSMRGTGVLAGMMILTGVGSAAFHAWGGPMATWLHDASLAALLVVIVAIEVSRRIRRESFRTPWSAVGAASVLVALWPVAGAVLAMALALAAATLASAPPHWSCPSSPAAAQPGRVRRLILPAGLLWIGAVVFLSSRTGGPLCRPDSLIQGHGLWHILAALGLWLYAARLGSEPASPSGLTDL
ncbi:MAG: ceramidase domain-containing protein [Acidimicrobiia bacterium]|nr:ceramidase domain-containing protein [Acidimicrobiia bacterium]